ncbi:MAG: SulP family inorganic anion transporter [Isosphaeraceae bacterium]
MSSISQVMGAADALEGRFLLEPRVQIRYLLGEWRKMFRRESLIPDLVAGISVALVALPLSLAIATASGVEPGVGLITAIVGGIVVALFGGCSLQVSGPAAAMTFLVYEIVTKYGMAGLTVATIIAALLQLGAGAFRLGRFIQFIPRPVIAGFLSGIGLTILCTQLSVILGYEVSHEEEGGALALLWQTVRNMHRMEPVTLVIGLVAIAAMVGLPRLSRRLPVPLIAVLAASLVPLFLDASRVAFLGQLPTSIPLPSLPRIPWEEWNELVMASVTVFLLATLESLLSASVTDSLAKGTRSDHNQELIGQGLGNLASALVGGIPVTGVIARSATNIQAGGRTRLSTIIHALILLAMLLGLAPLVARIPRAALAGVLIAVAFRMIEIRMLRRLWAVNRVEAAIFLTTCGAILVTDLIVGVPVGMIAAFMYVIYEISRLNLRPVTLGREEESWGEPGPEACPAVTVLTVEGPLFFASSFHLRNLVNRLEHPRCLVLDLEKTPFLDLSGSEILEEVIELLHRRGCLVVLARPSESVFRRLRSLDRDEFPMLRESPIYGELRDAMLHAATEFDQEHLCENCRLQGQCAALSRALKGIEALQGTPIPRVRAVIRQRSEVGQDHSRAADTVPGVATPLASVRESVRPSVATSWNLRTTLPTVDPTAYVDPLATVIGEVAIGARVYVGPGASVRADEGTPFSIGAESNLQDGVTVHGLRGKVVLVEGRPYAVYIGRNVSLTHHSLIHGPCYIGDRCFIGFKSMVHDSVVGEGCVVGLGAVVVGVTLRPGRYVAHNVVVDTQEKADDLPDVGPEWAKLRDEVLEVNQELAEGHRLAVRDPATLGRAAGEPQPSAN